MVFIYGGDFERGSSSIGVYDGTVLADQEDVVVVNFK
jgi:carboxylesterase type B